jgi:hypothetical protein
MPRGQVPLQAAGDIASASDELAVHIFLSRLEGDGLKSLRENALIGFSPAGTAENCPGRSPISANLFGRQKKSEKTLVFCIFTSPQKRHPERSASQMYRVTQRLWRGVEGPRGAYLTHAARTFSTTEARTGRSRHGLSPGPLEGFTAAYGCKMYP